MLLHPIRENTMLLHPSMILDNNPKDVRRDIRYIPLEDFKGCFTAKLSIWKSAKLLGQHMSKKLGSKGLSPEEILRSYS